MEGMEGKINKERYLYKAKSVYRPYMGTPPYPPSSIILTTPKSHPAIPGQWSWE